jgi:hypothetical protein
MTYEELYNTDTEHKWTRAGRDTTVDLCEHRTEREDGSEGRLIHGRVVRPRDK